MISFKDYLSIVNEDATADINRLNTLINGINVRIANATKPLQQQLAQLQKQLDNALKKQQAEQKQQPGGGQAPNPQAAPGSVAGGGQPGAAAPGMAQ